MKGLIIKMDKMKQYGSYIALLIGFALLSNFLIAVALNSNYKDMRRDQDDLSQVVIYQADSTKVNGRIRGMINNVKSIEDKYLKIELFTDRNVSMGKRYIEIDRTNEEMPLELFFKLNNVSHYKVSLTSQKDAEPEIEIMPKELTKGEIILGTALAIILFL
ncbi:MAG: hypothetical protein IJH76_06195 [Clostridia bacterium]|nr:hypothetical protein [Clostridia bacterium]